MNKFYMASHALIGWEGAYLLLRRSKTRNYKPQKWDLPGGGVEMGETLEEALVREVLEETKLTIKIDKIIFVYSNIEQVPTRQTFQAVYKCDYVQGQVVVDPREHDSFQWCKWGKIPSLDTIHYLTALSQKYDPSSH
jgi:8-oxo-dGTP pyrophosphatase MutT (NUDIX family)